MPPIVFSHANGFPAGTYRRLFDDWRAAGWPVHAVDRFGHDPHYPVTSNWPHLLRQLTDFIETHADGEPACLVGHSLGGYLSLMVACHRPDLVRALVLLDSPLIAGWKARALHLFKTTGWVSRVSPGRVSRRRRVEWAHRDEALAHFSGKPHFARWHPEVLRAYIDEGTAPQGERQVLSFRREVETAIYDTLPHHLDRLVHRHPPRCPVAFIGGTRSAEVRQVGLRATQRLSQGRVSWIEGSHLFPFERPDETAQRVDEVLRGLVGMSAGADGSRAWPAPTEADPPSPL